MAASKFARGDVVVADFAGDGGSFAFVWQGAHKNEAGETKFTIENPADGSKWELAYREPGDRDGSGSGGTFWAV